MATKKQEHTGFRNGDLFCFHCGTSYKMNLPQPIDMAAAIMKQFSKSHKDCVKTWVEPVAESNGKTEEENANWWLANGEHGISSKTMFKYLCSWCIIPISHESTPSDPGDFKRCYKLLQAVPQWKSELHKMKSVSPVWAKLVDNWYKLTEMYEQNVREDWKNYKKIGMYEFMKSLGC
jgi:hypothetical protein